LERYRQAELLAPQLPLLWLNEGLTCRHMMTPGSKGPESEEAINCAVRAFKRLSELEPTEPRGEQLYVQTLFDGDRLDILETRYREQVRRTPADLAAINGLIQVYARANRPEEALAAYQRKAALLPRDAEVHYAVGVFVWQQLFQRGGGPDKAGFDPRPSPAEASKPKGKQPRKVPPPFSAGDITGGARVAMADLGIKYLERAIALRPTYREAMVYLNLLYRQKAMAYFDAPESWQTAVDAAEKWRRQAEVAQAEKPPVGGPASKPAHSPDAQRKGAAHGAP
jgi:tetratricopeptide (TPR) repeat protein